jgi:hypothetical protein
MEYEFFIEGDHNPVFLKIEEIFKIIQKSPDKKYYKLIENHKILINNSFVLNTIFICHRINTIDELKNIPNIFGIEIDIRDNNNSNNTEKQIFLQHDPFIAGELFDTFIKYYNHKTIIFNVKSERVELRCLELIQKHSIKNYFFLDTNVPMIVYLNKNEKNNNIAVRFSEYEPLDMYERMKKMISWVWIDCFNKQPLTIKIHEQFILENKKTCIVSPELQKRPDDIYTYRNFYIQNNIIPTAICCKLDNIYKWI